jgi:hypothetical protein
MPPLPEAIILVLAPFAPRFSERVWRHAQVLLLGAMLTPGTRTVTAALEAMGLAAERRFTNDHRVLNRATWSARPGQSDTARLAEHAAGVPGRHPRARSRRHRGTPHRAHDQRQRMLSRCRALDQEARHPLLWLDVGVDAALGPSALAPTGVGAAFSDGVVWARGAPPNADGTKPVWIGYGR